MSLPRGAEWLHPVRADNRLKLRQIRIYLKRPVAKNRNGPHPDRLDVVRD
jgi:hypothetical protein